MLAHCQGYTLILFLSGSYPQSLLPPSMSPWLSLPSSPKPFFASPNPSKTWFPTGSQTLHPATPPTSLHSSNVHLISVQAHSCLKTFVRALPKAWGSLSPDFCRTRLFHYTGPSIQIAFSSDYSIPVYNAPFLSLCLPPPISQEFSP